MPERSRSSLTTKTKGMLERKLTISDSRSGVGRQRSFNTRLGANGPAETASQDLKNKPPNDEGDRDCVDLRGKLTKLSLHSLRAENLFKRSFNDRLSKVRSVINENCDGDVDVERNEAEFFISIEPTVQQTAERESLDEILSTFIKEEVEANGDSSEAEDTRSVVGEGFSYVKSVGPISEIMSKRNYLGNQKNEKIFSSNGYPRRYTLGETVIREEPVLELEESQTATSTSLQSDSEISKDADRRVPSRRSDIYQPKRSESPQCSAEKISRRDFPTSFGSGSMWKFRFFDCDVVEELHKYFSKRFHLSTKKDWKLPEPAQVFSAQPWEIKELIECKNKLNSVKGKLNDLVLKDWHAHTKKRNKAGQIVWKLRKTINPEFPTQAWCKFYENVSSFKLVPEKAVREKCLNSVHLCEAPGAFITSLNHYLKTNFDDDLKWDWLGTTLNPHYEGNPLSVMINEDRFILHTMEHWTFGEDQTGDLMTPPNVADLMTKAEELGEVLLVTADGSIDCQDDPGEQENYVAWLHYCEAFSALMVLAEGGNFLLKMFTMFEHLTVCLLYLLSCVFEEVIINKPATSKEGNSETYVVCKHYVGKSELEPWLTVLIENYGPNRPKKALFSKESIPGEFLDAVIECAETFRKYQSDVIEANLESYRHPDESEMARNEQIKKAVTHEFFYRYKLKELPDQFDIVGRHVINKMETYNMDPRLETGSFSDKKKRTAVPDRHKIQDLKKEIELLDRQVLDQWPLEKNIWWYEFDSDPWHNLSEDMKISTGKPVKRINNSKFCLGRLLDIRNKVREIILESKACKLPTLNCSTEQLVGVPHATSVLDFKNTLWASSDAGLNAEEEYEAFKKIIEEFDKLSRDDNLVICGYPLLTQFNVGLVYLLAHSFQRVALTRPQGQNFAVIFEKHDVSNKKFKVKQKLEEISESIQVGTPHGKTVLAMLPIQKLCKGDFYKHVTMANNICVKEQVLELIDIYLKATESKEEREKRRWTCS